MIIFRLRMDFKNRPVENTKEAHVKKKWFGLRSIFTGKSKSEKPAVEEPQ